MLSYEHNIKDTFIRMEGEKTTFDNKNYQLSFGVGHGKRK